MGSLVFLEDCFVDFFCATVFLSLEVVFSIKFIGLIGDMEMDESFVEEAGSWTGGCILLRDPIPLIKVKVNIK
jgi:hypothetical protein